MSWVNVGIAAASVASGAYGANQAGKAADKQSNAANRGIAEQARQYNAIMQMLEPNRYRGYQAGTALDRLYGFGSAGYQPANQLLNGSGGGGTSVKGITTQGMGVPNPAEPLGFTDPIASFLNGGETKQYGADINTLAGTVDVQGAGDKKDALYTNYLQTGEWTGGKGGRGKKIRSAIDALRQGGYSVDESGGGWEGAVDPRPAGEPGDMSGFFTSPGYQFRRDEGQRDIGNSFAARGGAASGNALRALTEFNQNTASQEFGNYQNALFNMAGMGQTATTQAIGAGQNNANNMTNLYGAQGDARASGVMGAANSIAGGVNSAANTWTLSKYLQGLNQGGGQQFSQYGPWANGYKFGG